MDESPDQPAEAPTITIECGMCKRKVPVDQARTLSGRVLCFGCISSWYDEEEDE